MDTQFNVFEVLRIAEEVDHRAAKFYLKAAERFSDPARRNLYYGMAGWRARHKQAWERIRKEYSERTGEFGTFDPDNYVRSNPHVMASLFGFGTGASAPNRPTGYETREQIVHDAIRRSEGVIIFFQGLKEFAGDPESRMMINNMISEEDRHIRLLGRSLEKMHSSADESDPFTSSPQHRAECQ